MPPGVKAVKDGGWLAATPGDADDDVVIFGAKGNKTGEFYSYNAVDSTWTTLASIPNGTEAKPPYKGAVGCADNAGHVYATKGNGTRGFWRYSVSGASWAQLPDVPLGPSGKAVKGGTDVAYVVVNDTGYVYLLKGLKQDFFRFNTVSGVWDTSLPAAPAGANPKWDKGSWVAFNPQPEPPGVPLIYAHKAKYHELWTFNVTTSAWGTAALPGMPLVGSMGKSKKSKDGGCGTYYDGALYALKGGNTQEAWRYTIATNAWTELETIPAFGSTAKKKRVKAGGDIVSWGSGAFFALKGNKTLEFWRYVLAPAQAEPRPERSGVAGAPAPLRGPLVAIVPNPAEAGQATLRYSLPQAGAATLRLYDVTGRTVLERSLTAGRTGTTGLDLSRLSAGVYLVKFASPGYQSVQKLIIQ
jgi:hypothetical protein